MEDRGRLGLVFLGVLLLIAALGYYIYNQRVNVASQKAVNLPPIKTMTPGQASPAPVVLASPSPISTTNPATLGAATKGGQLPKTGAPEVMLAVVYSTSALIAGWSLRKFPN